MTTKCITRNCFRNYLLTALSLLIVASSGCAAIRKASARRQHIHGETQNFVYQQPLHEVWPSARQLLFEAGYEVRDTGEATSSTLETVWKSSKDSRSRYLFQGVIIDDTHCRIQITRQSSRSTGGQSSGRDLDMEWRLIEMAEPERAAAINRDASTNAQKAEG